jgi:hypothetical protein
VRKRQKGHISTGCGIHFCTRFLKSRRSGDIFLPFIVEKARRSGFFDSLTRLSLSILQIVV